MTALWYSKEELAEARKKVSNVMFQTVQRKNDDGSTTNLLRFVAIAGSQYPDFDEIGFVISTTNATPTIEGGYDYVVVGEQGLLKLGVSRPPAPQRPTTMLTSFLELIPATRASLSKMHRGASPRTASLQLMLLRVLQARQAIRMRVCSTPTSLSPMLIRTPFTS